MYQNSDYDYPVKFVTIALIFRYESPDLCCYETSVIHYKYDICLKSNRDYFIENPLNISQKLQKLSLKSSFKGKVLYNRTEQQKQQNLNEMYKFYNKRPLNVSRWRNFKTKRKNIQCSKSIEIVKFYWMFSSNINIWKMISILSDIQTSNFVLFGNSDEKNWYTLVIKCWFEILFKWWPPFRFFSVHLCENVKIFIELNKFLV